MTSIWYKLFISLARNVNVFQGVAACMSVGGYCWMLSLSRGDAYLVPAVCVFGGLALSVMAAVIWCLRPSELRDPEACKMLQESLQDIKAGRLHDHEDVKSELWEMDPPT